MYGIRSQTPIYLVTNNFRQCLIDSKVQANMVFIYVEVHDVHCSLKSCKLKFLGKLLVQYGFKALFGGRSCGQTPPHAITTTASLVDSHFHNANPIKIITIS